MGRPTKKREKFVMPEGWHAQEYRQDPLLRSNIFYFDDDPWYSAQCVCDFHLIRAILFGAEILSSVWRLQHGGEYLQMEWSMIEAELAPPRSNRALRTTLFGNRIYPATLCEHPTVKYAEAMGGNYVWIYENTLAMLEEYTYRSQGRVFGALPAVRALEAIPPFLLETRNEFCEPPVCLPAKYEKESTPDSYKAWYRDGAGINRVEYTNRKRPDWIAAGILTGGGPPLRGKGRFCETVEATKKPKHVRRDTKAKF